MKRWKCLIFFIGIPICLQGCSAPPINPVELPQHGLDFKFASDKKTYQLGEPVVIKVKVKNFKDKTRTLRILPDEKHGFSFEYLLTYGSVYWSYSSDKIVTLTIPPNREVEISEMRWVWDQIDPWLKEPVGVGWYTIQPVRLGNVEVDGQSVGSVTVIIKNHAFAFKIVHPVYERVVKKGIDFRVAIGDTSSVEEELKNIHIQMLSINRSERQRTILVKPIGANPSVRIRVLGPVSETDRPLLRAVHEFKEVFSVTLPPKSGWVKVMEFTWDFRDQMTGEILPTNKLYVAFVEICGSVEINGETVGTIANPIKIAAQLFRKEG